MTKSKAQRTMSEIPIAAARELAERYGYDQIVIIARRVGKQPDPCGEHVTTYGIGLDHSRVAARMGDHLKYRVMGWNQTWPKPDTGG